MEATREKAPPRVAVAVAQGLRKSALALADRLVPAPVAAIDRAHAFTTVHIMATIAELGIADHLMAGARTAEELAPVVGADPDAVHRLLRAAASVGLVKLGRDGRFRATRLTAPLRRADSSGLADWSRYLSSRSHLAAWADLAQTIRNGENAFRRVNGMESFEWFSRHPAEGQRFSKGLGGLTRLEAAMIVGSYPFPHSGVICDVGGGAGVLLSQILVRRPRLTGVLIDNPFVLENAADYLDSAGVANRVRLVEGDFFNPCDVEADLYLLKWVLHDWDDGTCQRILRNLAGTMPDGARLLVIEGDQAPNRPHPRFSMIDPQMLTVSEGGRERSSEGLRVLLRSAGLIPTSVHHTPTGLAMVEATAPTNVGMGVAAGRA